MSYALQAEQLKLENARNAWMAKDQPFVAQFWEAPPILPPPDASTPSSSSASTSTPDATTNNSNSNSSSNGVQMNGNGSTLPTFAPSSLDLLFSFKHLHRSPSCTSTALHDYLYAASMALKEGGLLIGSMYDPSAVWYKITKKERDGPPRQLSSKDAAKIGQLYNGQYYRIEFQKLYRYNPKFIPFDQSMKFYFQLHYIDPNGRQPPILDPHPTAAHLIPIPTLLSYATRCNLHLISMQNYVEFYNEYEGCFTEGLKACHLDKLNSAQLDLFSLFTTFVFEKKQMPSNV